VVIIPVKEEPDVIPIPWIILLILSFGTYQQARGSGRNAIFWVAAVWVLGVVGGFTFGLVYTGVVESATDRSVGYQESFWPMMAGIAAGGMFATWAAGRKITQDDPKQHKKRKK
jgi:hypothetical protein